MRFGVIADTHGLVRPEALSALKGVDAILHAGDVGSPEVLAALEALAPVTAVRGNNDTEPWCDRLPETATVTAGGLRIHLLHDVNALSCDLAAAGFAAVVAGHSHVPRCERVGDLLLFNPGSAGPRRFRLPVSVGFLTIEGGRVGGELRMLEIAAPVVRSRPHRRTRPRRR